MNDRNKSVSAPLGGCAPPSRGIEADQLAAVIPMGREDAACLRSFICTGRIMLL